jgi:predicted porin
MQKIFFLVLITMAAQANAQTNKLAINVQANAAVPINKNLQIGSGYTVGLQYGLNKRSNILLNYANFKNEIKNTNPSITIYTKQITLGYQYYFNKSKTLYASAEAGSLLGNKTFRPVIALGIGYTKQISSRLSFDAGIRCNTPLHNTLNNMSFQFFAGLKFKL